MDTLNKEMDIFLEDGLDTIDWEHENFYRKLLNFWI